MTQVLSVRVSEEEKGLLQMASEISRSSLSEFVRRKALESAEIELMQPRSVVIPADNWDSFEAWIDAPAQANSKLSKLLNTPPVWEK